MASPAATSSQTGMDRVGRDLLPAGRTVRILAGLLLLLSAVSSLSDLRPLSPARLGQVLLAMLVSAAIYTLAAWVLGERVLARVGPWLGAITLVAPATLALFFLPFSATVGYNAFVGVSLLAQAAIGYGGCELLGIPTLLLRRRYRVYCVFNGADVVERWLRTQPGLVRWTLALLAFAATMALLVLATSVGGPNGERLLYLLFLVVGLGISRALQRGPGPAIRAGSTIGAC